MHAFAQRPAKDGDILVNHRFHKGEVMGLVSRADLQAMMASSKPKSGKGLFARMWQWWLTALKENNTKDPCAVCLSKGAMLHVSGLSEAIQYKLNVGPEELVTFDQEGLPGGLSHRDGFRFANGRFLLLQYIFSRITVNVLSTTGSLPQSQLTGENDESEPEREELPEELLVGAR